MRSAIVATVLNEARHIREFLASLEAQSRIPDVIVITDGGSTDGTPEMLHDFLAICRHEQFPIRFQKKFDAFPFVRDEAGASASGWTCCPSG